jgi:23S rRNA (cytosine1962-C5)-methyltransferase
LAVSELGRIVLKPGRDKPLRGGNPWIFSQAISRAEPASMEAGTMVEVADAAGDTVAFGYYNPRTTIAVRVLVFGADRASDIATHRIANALRMRRHIIRDDTNCYRVVNGDGDGLSGVVIDRYADVFVVQLLTAGAERMRGEIVAALTDLARPRCILERSQGAVRRQEGLADSVEVLAGEEPKELCVCENGLRLEIDLVHGQKTGYFLDQRDNRALARRLSAESVLDAYCYAGGFTLAALAGGAQRVAAIDTSARALSSARRNLALNKFADSDVELIHGEAAPWMLQHEGEFDLVVLDPPALARSIKDSAHAAHLYAELNALAMRVLKPGGHLMTFSCSVHFRGEDFIRAVRFAQARCGRNFRIIAHLGAGADHPVLLGHPEGEYLTGLFLADLN